MVEVRGRTYTVKDWSVLGVGIPDLAENIEIGEEIEATVILPLHGASIQLPVVLICRRKQGNITGFEFKDLPERNRRVLRQYIDFAIEGRLDDIETIFAAHNAPTIKTPIGDALALAESEQTEMVRRFKRHMWGWLALGATLILSAAGIIIYNTIFVFEEIGVVVADLHPIKASHTGTIEKIYVTPGSIVKKGEVLFEFFVADLLIEKERLQRQIALIEDSVRQEASQDSSYLKVLKEKFEKQKREYENAKRLYEKKIISLKDYMFIENSYVRAKLEYLEKSRSKIKAADLSLLLKLEELKKELKAVKDDMEKRRIRAPFDGKIYALNKSAGEFVFTGNTVLVMQSNAPMYVLVKVPNWELAKISFQEPVKIYDPVSGRTFEGDIENVGLSTVNPEVPLSQEVSLKGSLIKVKVSDLPLGLMPNSRVRIWFRNKIFSKIKYGLAEVWS